MAIRDGRGQQSHAKLWGRRGWRLPGAGSGVTSGGRGDAPHSFVPLPSRSRAVAGEVPDLCLVCPPRPPPEHFLLQGKAECLYTNVSQRVRFVLKFIWDQQQYVHFDSDVGVFVADTVLGQPDATYWNSQKEELEYTRGAVDSVCQRNYGVAEQAHVLGRSGESLDSWGLCCPHRGWGKQPKTHAVAPHSPLLTVVLGCAQRYPLPPIQVAGHMGDGGGGEIWTPLFGALFLI